jgi:vaccinia related kinase
MKLFFFVASSDIMLPVGQDAKYVVKIEPHNNGPLFVEMNFYIRTARKHMSKQYIYNDLY